MNFRCLYLASLTVALALVGCGGGSNPETPSNPPPPAPSFVIKLSKASVPLIAGDQCALAVKISPQNGFSANVSLSIGGLPSGVTANFTPSSISPSETATLVLQTPATTPGLTANFQITGSSGSFANSQTATLTVLTTPSLPSTRSSYVEVGGPIHEIAYDPTHKLVFAANPQLNEVEVVSTNTLQRLPPLLIPQPYTLDVTPDGKRLWVGNTGEFLDAVDLTTMHIVQHITPPRTGASPLTNIRALITTSNGSLLLRVGIVGLTGSEGLLLYDPATRAFVDRTKDAPVPMRFVRNATGSKVLLSGWGAVVLYDADSDTFIRTAPSVERH